MFSQEVIHPMNILKLSLLSSSLKCRSSSRAAATAGGESPSMADMSSNQESPHSPQKQPRAKKGGGKRKSRNRNLLTPPNQGYSSGAEQSQSAFPVPTPDRLGKAEISLISLGAKIVTFCI